MKNVAGHRHSQRERSTSGIGACDIPRGVGTRDQDRPLISDTDDTGSTVNRSAIHNLKTVTVREATINGITYIKCGIIKSSIKGIE
jgi:hypothetical protein